MSSEGQKLVGNLKEGLLFVVSAPSGTGKSTLVRMLVEEFPAIKRSISCTTRKKRPGEIEDLDYHFLTEAEFREKASANVFLEQAQVFDAHYGTSSEVVQRQLEKGFHVVLVIDTQGALQVKEKVKATLIFIAPPSLEELRLRLERRGTESEEQIQLRLQKAKEEMKAAERYDYQIVNDHLPIAYEILRSIVIAAEHRTQKK